MTRDPAPSYLPAQMPLPGARDHVVELLKARFVDNHLSIAEFEQRVGLAHQARSRGELDALLADLVPAAAPGTESAPAAFPDSSRHSRHPSASDHGRIVAILSNNERRGQMALPRRLEIVAILGDVELDLGGASIPVGVSEIDISAVFGDVQLMLPMDVRVESTGNAFLGSFDHRPHSFPVHEQSNDRVIRITGHSVFGSVTIDASPMLSPPFRTAETGAPRRLG